MRTIRDRNVRLSGAPMALIVVSLCLVLAPTALYAAEQMVSIIRDPYNSSAMARVSEDGRLGVRGETTSQQGVPANEWHNSVAGRAGLLWSAPAGSGIGIAQMTVENLNPHRAGFVRVLLSSTTADGACPEERGPEGNHLYEAYVRVPHDLPIASEQFVFPVPLTVPASPDKGVCLYAQTAQPGVIVRANGVSGPMTPQFVPPKGQDTPPPEQDDKDTQSDTSDK